MTLGIYIQVPFCQTKCTYCNFHTGVVSKERYQPYADAVCREIAETAKPDAPHVDTIYFGGGTPSLLEPAALARMITTVRRTFRCESCEITLEADPGTITAEKTAAWRDAGINRISLGAQSFDDRELQAAGRMYRGADIFTAAQTLRAAGFDNISMDLIAGLAHQTRESWEQSVTQLLRIRPEHISIYMLEIDEGSHLGKESLAGGSRYSANAIPDEDAMADFYDSACARLAADRYEHYEISNLALAGRRSRHNLKYWRREAYLGFGAGAHSFDGAQRWANCHDSARYVECVAQGISPREQIVTVTPAEAFDEELFLGLRQLEGIDLGRIESAYDESQHDRVTSLRERIRDLRAQGLVEVEGTRLRLAPGRLSVSNEVFVELLG